MSQVARRRNDIQALRGISVIAVVFFHAKESYFPLGYLGVDIFLIISGYVVTPLIIEVIDKPNRSPSFKSLRKFYVKRIYRLGPAFGTVVALTSFSIFLLVPISDHNRFSIQGILAMFQAGNFGAVKYSGDYFSPAPSPFTHFWSLAVEVQFYILMPLIFFLIFKFTFFSMEKFIKYLTLFTILSCCLYFIDFLNNFLNLKDFSYYSPLNRIWQFTLGGAIFCITNFQNFSTQRKFNYLRHSLIFIFTIFLFSQLNFNQKLATFSITVLTGMILISKSFDLLPLYIMKFLKWFGDRSYSIYLVHFPLFYYAKHSYLFSLGDNYGRQIQSIFALFLTVIIGNLSYNLVEEKYRALNVLIEEKKYPILVTFVLPFFILLGLFFGSKTQYANLAMNITTPVADWEKYNECELLSDPSSKEIPCFSQFKSSKKTALLVGDSHAAHFALSFIRASKNNNYNAAIWTSPGCLFQLSNNTKKLVDKDCIARNRRILEWVKFHKPELVLVSQFTRNDSSFPELQTSLSQLKKEVDNLWLVENNPIFKGVSPFDVPILLQLFSYEPQKIISIVDLNLNDLQASKDFSKWAKANDIGVLDFWPVLCDKKKCKRFDKGDWLYFDSDHFSSNGSRVIYPVINKIFN